MSLILETKNLSKSFGSAKVLKNVNFSVQAGTIHAILGENGAGKSTLLKILFGLYKPTSGEVFLRGHKSSIKSPLNAIFAGLGMVQQHFSLVEELSVIDNIVLGHEPINFLGSVDRKAAILKLEKLLPNQLKLDWHRAVESLSVGEKQKLEIVKLLFLESEILFLDEPTAVLTPQEVKELFVVLRELKNQGKTIIIITHKLHEVKELCDDFTVIRRGEVVGRGLVEKTSVSEMVEMMIGRRLAELVATTPKAGAVLVEMHDVGQGLKRKGSLQQVNIKIHSGEIVGIAGVEGAGQSEIVDLICGLSSYSQGKMKVFSSEINEQKRNPSLGVVPEDRQSQGLWMEASLAENFLLGLEDLFFDSGFTGHLINDHKLSSKSREWLEQYDVRYNSINQTAGSLSGGNQQKLILAREIEGRDLKLLICHHPTRGVDLGAIEQIHKKILELRDHGIAVLLISSDLDELMKLSDRIYALYEGKTMNAFLRAEFNEYKIGAAMLGEPK